MVKVYNNINQLFIFCILFMNISLLMFHPYSNNLFAFGGGNPPSAAQCTSKAIIDQKIQEFDKSLPRYLEGSCRKHLPICGSFASLGDRSEQLTFFAESNGCNFSCGSVTTSDDGHRMCHGKKLYFNNSISCGASFGTIIDNNSCLGYSYACYAADKFCTPYDPPVPSWEEIENKAREYESDANVSYDINNLITEDIKNRYELFDLDDSNNLGQYVSCGDSGRIKKNLKTRNTLSNFKYCTKWKLGIDKNYVGNVGLSDNKPEQIDPNKFKVFCESVSYTNTSPSTTGFNSNSISSSTKHVCRDGVIKDGDGSCNVPTHLEMKLCKRYYGFREDDNCESWDEKGRCESYGQKLIMFNIKSWPCDVSTYDTNKIKFYEYNINICINPSIDSDKLRNGIKLQPTYDPNMVYY